MSRRDDVVRAAIEVFREKGYERATVRDIAARADMAISSLYDYMDSKEEIFLTTVRPGIVAGCEHMEAIAASGLSPQERLRAAVVGLTELFDRQPETFVYLNSFFPVLEQKEPELHERYERLWTDLVAEVIEERGDAGRLDPQLVAYGILGMCHWLYRWYKPGGRSTATEIGEMYADVVLEGLGPR